MPYHTLFSKLYHLYFLLSFTIKRSLVTFAQIDAAFISLTRLSHLIIKVVCKSILSKIYLSFQSICNSNFSKFRSFFLILSRISFIASSMASLFAFLIPILSTILFDLIPIPR